MGLMEIGIAVSQVLCLVVRESVPSRGTTDDSNRVINGHSRPRYSRWKRRCSSLPSIQFIITVSRSSRSFGSPSRGEEFVERIEEGVFSRQ